MKRVPNVSVVGMPFEKRDLVRVGLAGLGSRQGGLMRNMLSVDGAEITAIWDADPEASAKALATITESGARPPVVCGEGMAGLDELVARDDVDIVLVATPWRLHVPMALTVLNAGKHVGVEVPAAVTLEECWELVEASERNRRHCVILENCCYGDEELLVLNMVKAGAFGELLHGEAAYIHDLRKMLLTNKAWRRQAHIDRNGNLYPTHGLGPVAMYMGINRGDRLTSLVSMSSPALGLQKWRAENIPAGDPIHDEVYQCGDVNTSILQTAAGLTIMLQHQVVGPRPYDRLNVIVGTDGVFEGFPARIYLGSQDGPEEYTGLDAYKEQYQHHLWRDQGERALKAGGHGGMDYIMLSRLVDCMRRGVEPDLDVYDAAAWSAPGPLSDASVAQGGAPVEIPDFTRGAWKNPRPRID
jgi:predicted dehydrogenase